MAGISDETALNVLAAHDRLSDTALRAAALAGRPRLCQSCHADVALAAEGDPELLGFSAAMHGWHANYLAYGDERDCALCHPASNEGSTRCSRGFHNTRKLTCVDCHGTMHDHAVAL